MTILRSKIAIRLRLRSRDGEEFLLPVTALSQTFAVNEISSCTLQLGVGANVSKEDLPNAIPEAALPLMREHQFCEVISIIEGDYAPGVEWNDEPQVIFYGKIAGISNMLVENGVGLTVTINHWMAGLQSGTILTAYANPLDPRNSFMQASTYGSRSQTGLAEVAAIGSILDAAKLTPDDFAEDMWTYGIKEFIARLLTQDLVGPLPQPGETLDEFACSDAINRPSGSLKEAWTRIEGPTSVLGSPYSKWAVPLKISPPGGEINSRIIESMRETITHNPVSAYQNADAWSKLVSYFLPGFDLMLVPRVKTAIIAPKNISLRQPYCHRIVADDIDQIDASDVLRRPIKAVGVIGQFQSSTNLAKLAGLLGVSPSVLACYNSEDDNNNGRTAMVKPPPFLQRFVTDKAIISGFFRSRKPPGGLGNPGDSPDEEKVQNVADGVYQVQAMFAEYAKQYYFNRQTQGRTCRVNGKLRFDISPGSMVEILAKPEQVRGLSTDSPHLQGQVTRVTIAIDVRRKTASTSFQVSNVRTKTENDDESFTLERHPLYEHSFTGATLLDEYENEPCQE